MVAELVSEASFIKKKRVAIENIKSRQSWYRSLYPEVKFLSAICSSWSIAYDQQLGYNYHFYDIYPKKKVHKAQKNLHLRTKMKTQVPAGEDSRNQYMKMIVLQKYYQSWYESN